MTHYRFRAAALMGIVIMTSGILEAQPLRATVSASGKIVLEVNGATVGAIEPGLFEDGWRGGTFGPAGVPGQADDGLQGVIRAPSGALVTTTLSVTEVDTGVRFDYTLVPQQPITVNSLHVGCEIPETQLAGRPYDVDGEAGTVPQTRGETHLSSRATSRLRLDLRDGGPLTFAFPGPAPVLLQDNRQWGPSFSVRVGNQAVPAETLPAEVPVRIVFTLAAPSGISLDIDEPVTITAGDDWVPLDYNVEIEPDSALDFSNMGLHDAPAGKHGWLLARPNGTFAFEDSPDVPRRFYGVNFCFTAHYLTKEQADALAARLARMGYNAIRVHHYESTLVRQSRGGSSITDLPIDRPPTRTENVNALQTREKGDHYGQRIRGFLVPPATGAYTFSVASDDASQLWLGTSAAAESRRLLASVPGWTGSDEFDKYDSQRSEPVRLESGRRYYLEVLHKEGSGGDHLTVAWEGPGVPFATVAGEALTDPDGRPGQARLEVWAEAEADRVEDSTTPIPERLDQLDYFLAAFRKQGIYITTDLYVSRPVYASELWDDATGDVAMDDFKMAVPVNERAFENWKAFTRNLLSHRNTYTGLTYAEDPALAWLAMINEGNVGNHLGGLEGRIRQDWTRAWNSYLAGAYATREALAEAWDGDPGGDPAAGTVPLFTDIHSNSPRGRDLAAFCATVEARMFERMRTFLRDELGCRALLTNMNGWTNRMATHAARAGFDYIDDHFYVDHPRFLVNRWQLPSSCPNTSPIRAKAPGGRGNCFVRQFDKPFTISEYNYSGPGRFRGVGGILTGCLGALQSWDVIWRFAYSHSRGNLFAPSPAGYFDIVTDPLNQVADRAAVCLYLRGDLREADHAVAQVGDPQTLLSGRAPNLGATPGWSDLAWMTKVGTFLTDGTRPVPADLALHLTADGPDINGATELGVQAHSPDARETILKAMRERGWLPAGNDNRVLRSETGELTIDAGRDVLVLNTPRTAGGYGPEGETIATDAVHISLDETYATVWVSSLDGQPIRSSKHLILCHLTDLQNSGARFAEKARKTLLAWGRLPHLVRTGRATVRIDLNDAARAAVYALSTSGTRLHRVPASVREGALVVEPTVRGPDGHARLVYEITVD